MILDSKFLSRLMSATTLFASIYAADRQAVVALKIHNPGLDRLRAI